MSGRIWGVAVIEELQLILKYGQSFKAFDIVMKLLFGFKDVVVPEEEYIQVLAIIEELSISNIIMAAIDLKYIRNIKQRPFQRKD